MESEHTSILATVVTRYKQQLLQAWIKSQLEQLADRQDVITENELREQSAEFLDLLEQGLTTAAPGSRIQPAMWQELHRAAHDMARRRAAQGFTAAETATFIFGLKRLIFARLRDEVGDSEALIEAIWQATTILDRLGLFTTEVFLQSREDIIRRQQQEMIELSTPVVNLWEGILAVPLIGTLDSARTQTVTESLLDKIMQTGADVAIIDITGVPVVDTLVAQHLLKSVAAARLMGAECIISGIRPQIAQTIVHLGVDLAGVTTKADLSSAFAYALQRKGFLVASTSAV